MDAEEAGGLSLSLSLSPNLAGCFTPEVSVGTPDNLLNGDEIFWVGSTCRIVFMVVLIGRLRWSPSEWVVVNIPGKRSGFMTGTPDFCYWLQIYIANSIPMALEPVAPIKYILNLQPDFCYWLQMSIANSIPMPLKTLHQLYIFLIFSFVLKSTCSSSCNQWMSDEVVHGRYGTTPPYDTYLPTLFPSFLPSWLPSFFIIYTHGGSL